MKIVIIGAGSAAIAAAGGSASVLSVKAGSRVSE